MKHLIIALKGLFVGGTMLVPGVSGGSMAMILGIYHELIASISSFLKHKKESLLFLGVFVVGALVGMALFARPLEALIERFPMPTLYFFIGAVVGGVPLRLADTAGLRETQDAVERIGVERAKKRIRSAQLVLAVFDSSRRLGESQLLCSAHRQWLTLLPSLQFRVALRKLQPQDTHFIFPVKQDAPMGFVPFLRRFMDTSARRSGVQQSRCPVFRQSFVTTLPSAM